MNAEKLIAVQTEHSAGAIEAHRIIPLHEVSTSRVELTHGQVLDYDIHERTFANGSSLKGIAYHFGVPVNTSELEAEMRVGGYGEMGYTGYKRLYTATDQLTARELVDQELAITTQLAMQTMELNGLSPHDVDALYISSGTPLTDDPRYADADYATLVAEATGLAHLPLIRRQNYYAACNSWGLAMHDMLGDTELQGKNVLSITVDGLRRKAPGRFNPELLDETAARLFSNAAAGMIIRPGDNMSLIQAYDQEGKPLSYVDFIPDSKAVLGVHAPYSHMYQADKAYIETDNVHHLRMPTPREQEKHPNRNINMSARGTTAFFYKHGLNLTKDFLQRHANLRPDNPLGYILFHPASLQIVRGQYEKLLEMGIDIPTGWFKVEGNSSSASTPVSFLRGVGTGVIPEGRDILLDIAGAGASFSLLDIQLG